MIRLQLFNWAYASLCLLLLDTFLIWQIIKRIKPLSSFTNPIISPIKDMLKSVEKEHVVMIFTLYMTLLMTGFFMSFIWYILVGIQSISILSNMFVLALLIGQTK